MKLVDERKRKCHAFFVGPPKPLEERQLLLMLRQLRVLLIKFRGLSCNSSAMATWS